MQRTLPTSTVVLLLSLSVAPSAQAAPMDTWKITIESETPLSADVRKGIEGAAEYIIRELIPEWEDYASIQCFLRVMEREGEMYKVTLAISAEDANGEAVYVEVLFEYDAQTGGYVVKEEEPTPTTTPPIITPPSPPKIGISISSKFELSKDTEKSIKDVAQQLVEKRINVEELGGVAVECFVLNSEGGWYTVYARVFARPPPPGLSEPSQGEAKAWEAAFKCDLNDGTYDVASFSEVDSFLVTGDAKQKAMTIGEKEAEIKAFVIENTENNLTSQADWINRDEEIVRLQYTAALLLNETHALYKGLTAYINMEDEEVLYTQRHQGVWYAPGLRATPETGEIGTPPPAASTPVDYYCVGAILTAAIAVGIGISLVTRKIKS